MPKKAKSGPNKSVAIREYKAANPEAKPKQIAEALSGLNVSAQFVSTVLSNDKKKGKGAKRGPKPGSKAATTDLQSLLHAKKLVTQLGGVDAARAAINALAQLLD